MSNKTHTIRNRISNMYKRITGKNKTKKRSSSSNEDEDFNHSISIFLPTQSEIKNTSEFLGMPPEQIQSLKSKKYQSTQKPITFPELPEVPNIPIFPEVVQGPVLPIPPTNKINISIQDMVKTKTEENRKLVPLLLNVNMETIKAQQELINFYIKNCSKKHVKLINKVNNYIKLSVDSLTKYNKNVEFINNNIR